jgi:carbon monoxide dehydrogenase subunit G
MEFKNEFDVAAPVDEVFKTLLDVERVAPCVPGAEVLEKVGDDSYKVAIKIKLGPVTMQYRGDVEVVDKDEATHTATMHVRAKETRGQGNADATSRIELSEHDGGTHATITTDVKLSGRAAAMGGRMVGDVSAKMVDTFAQNLSKMLEGPGDAGEPTTDETPAVSAGDTPSPADDAPSAGTPSTVEAAATESSPKDAPRKKPPLREAPPPAAESELNALDLAGSVIAGRLSEPKTLAVVVGGAFALGFLVGRRRG